MQDEPLLQEKFAQKKKLFDKGEKVFSLAGYAGCERATQGSFSTISGGKIRAWG